MMRCVAALSFFAALFASNFAAFWAAIFLEWGSHRIFLPANRAYIHAPDRAFDAALTVLHNLLPSGDDPASLTALSFSTAKKLSSAIDADHDISPIYFCSGPIGLLPHSQKLRFSGALIAAVFYASIPQCLPADFTLSGCVWRGFQRQVIN